MCKQKTAGFSGAGHDLEFFCYILRPGPMGQILFYRQRRDLLCKYSMALIQEYSVSHYNETTYI